MTDSGRRAAGAGLPLRPGLVYTGFTGRWRWGVPGTRSPLRWFFSTIWLVYLIAPVSDLFSHRVHGHLVENPVLWIAGGLAITAAFCAAYVCLLGIGPSARWRVRSCLAILVALGVLACVVYGQGWLSVWIYVSAAVGFAILSRRLVLLAVVVVVGCYSLLAWVTHASMSNFLTTLLPVALFGIVMSGFRIQLALMHELSQARETVAKLAANEERLRVTRDMHDLTGQSLSMITLKSDLARKILDRLPDSAERDAAMSELADIGRVSRQTLHDIREALSGYRRPTLAIEIITARAACEAAGIALDDGPELTVRSGSVDAEAEAVLAWCLREAVTNVVRHSGARHCRIRLHERDGELSLEVADDGRGLAGDHRLAGGTGLHGMSERLSGVGGRLSLGSADPARRHGHGLRLVATVPVPPAGAHAASRQSALGGMAAAREG